MKRDSNDIRRQFAYQADSGLSGLTARVVLGLAVAIVGAVLVGSGGLAGSEGAPTATLAHRPTYIDRKVGSTYEGIALNADGTYRRTLVDGWGNAHQQQGTWRGYGGTFQSGRSQVSRRLELDGYSDARDVINSRGSRSAPTSTKTLSSGDFYTR